MMPRLSILGGRGMLGSELAKSAAASGYETQICDLPDFDICNERMLEKALLESDITINCAAYTNVDKAETERDFCDKINHIAVASLGKIAARHGRYVIHVGTDFVFGDNSTLPLDENSPAAPLSHYGRTKLDGEIALQKSGCKCAIMRVEWTYGAHGNNFISKIVDLSSRMPEIKVVSDQTGSPTDVRNAASAILCLAGQRATGIYHYADKGYATRFEVAEFIVETLALPTRLIAVGSSEFPSPAKRPLNSRFDCSKIDRILDFKRPRWHDSLGDFLKSPVK